MKICTRCGAFLSDEDSFCPDCNPEYNKSATNPDDSSSIGFALLGFFIPLVGLILYLAWRKETPLKARSAGTGALIGFMVSILSAMFWGIFLGVTIQNIITSLWK